MESFYTGLLGFLVGKGVSPADSKNIVEALQRYLGFEPPVGLTGYALTTMTKGKEYKTSVVVRGKTYDAKALEDIQKHQQIAVLSKTGACLDVAPVSTLWKLNIEEIATIKTIRDLIHRPKELILNPSFEDGLTGWYHSTILPEVVSTPVANVGGYALKFKAKTNIWIDQFFPIAIDPDWFTSLNFYILATVPGITTMKFFYYENDGTFHKQDFTVSTGGYELKTITKPSNPFFGCGFQRLGSYEGDCYLDTIFMVI